MSSNKSNALRSSSSVPSNTQSSSSDSSTSRFFAVTKQDRFESFTWLVLDVELKIFFLHFPPLYNLPRGKKTKEKKNEKKTEFRGTNFRDGPILTSFAELIFAIDQFLTRFAELNFAI